MSDAVGLTQRLARHAAAADVSALPDAVRHEGARAFVNWIAVTIGGCGEDAVAAATRYVSASGRTGTAQVIGRGVRTDASSAAFVNCIGSSGLAYDDAHLPTVAHPSGPAAAALFALAETRRVSGADFVTALALGIEVQCRVANMLVLPPAPMNTSLYVNGFSGPIGVAAAAGRLIGLDARRISWAIGIAASQAGGFRSVHGTMTAHFRPGHATRCGVDAALLAADGFDCTDDALESRGGFIDVFAPGSDPAVALDGLGHRHVMLENRYKPYPCGIVIHPVIDACQAVRAQLLRGAAIARVRLDVNPLVLALTGKRSPTTALESHVSVFHWAAVALLQDAPGLAATRDACLADPQVIALRDRITAEAVATMDKGAAGVTVTLDDGREFTAHVAHARGSGERPMTDAELDAKFTELTAGRLAPAAADALRDACWRVAELDDVGGTIGGLLSSTVEES